MLIPESSGPRYALILIASLAAAGCASPQADPPAGPVAAAQAPLVLESNAWKKISFDLTKEDLSTSPPRSFVKLGITSNATREKGGLVAVALAIRDGDGLPARLEFVDVRANDALSTHILTREASAGARVELLMAAEQPTRFGVSILDGRGQATRIVREPSVIDGGWNPVLATYVEGQSSRPEARNVTVDDARTSAGSVTSGQVVLTASFPMASRCLALLEVDATGSGRWRLSAGSDQVQGGVSPDGPSSGFLYDGCRADGVVASVDVTAAAAGIRYVAIGLPG